MHNRILFTFMTIVSLMSFSGCSLLNDEKTDNAGLIELKLREYIRAEENVFGLSLTSGSVCYSGNEIPARTWLSPDKDSISGSGYSLFIAVYSNDDGQGKSIIPKGEYSFEKDSVTLTSQAECLYCDYFVKGALKKSVDVNSGRMRISYPETNEMEILLDVTVQAFELDTLSVKQPVGNAYDLSFRYRGAYVSTILE